MKQPELLENEIQLTDSTRLHFDKQNLTLTKRYQKRGGKGKGAPLIDEYAYGGQSYFGNIEVLGKRLVDKEFMEGMSAEEIKQAENLKEIIDYAIEHINKVKEEVISHLKENITIDLGDKPKKPTTKKIKGMEVIID